MKALVLGATGQLGNNLVRVLLAKGTKVRVLVRPNSKLQTQSIERALVTNATMDNPR